MTDRPPPGTPEREEPDVLVAPDEGGGPESTVVITPQKAGLFGATASIVVCRGITALASALVVAVTARQLGPEGRGVIVLMLMLAPFTMLVCSLGTNIAARIHLVAADDPIPVKHYLGLTVVLAIVDGVLSAVVGATLLPLVDVKLSGPEIVLFALLGVTSLLQTMLADALNSLGFTVRAAVVEAVGFVVQLVAVFALALGGTDSVSPFVVAIVVAGWVQVVMAFLSLRGATPSLRPKWNRRDAVRLVRSGFVAIPNSLSQVLTFRVDRYLMGLFLTPAAVGVYSVAATAPELLRIIPLALSQSVFYRVASRTATACDFRHARRVAMAVMAALVAVTYLFAPVAVRLAFGSEFEGAVTPLRILLFAEFGITLFYIDGSIVGGLGRLGHLSLISLAGLVVVTIADIILIQTSGLAGAAWASVLAYSVMGAASHLLWRKRTAVQSSDRRLDPNVAG